MVPALQMIFFSGILVGAVFAGATFNVAVKPLDPANPELSLGPVMSAWSCLVWIILVWASLIGNIIVALNQDDMKRGTFGSTRSLFVLVITATNAAMFAVMPIVSAIPHWGKCGMALFVLISVLHLVLNRRLVDGLARIGVTW